MGFATTAIHAGQEPDEATGSVTVPIYQTSTYAQEALGKRIARGDTWLLQQHLEQVLVIWRQVVPLLQ